MHQVLSFPNQSILFRADTDGMAIIIMLRMFNAKARCWCGGHLLQCAWGDSNSEWATEVSVISGLFLEGRWGEGVGKCVHFTINLKIIAFSACMFHNNKIRFKK